MQNQGEPKPLAIATPALTITKVALYVLFCRLHDRFAIVAAAGYLGISSVEKCNGSSLSNRCRPCADTAFGCVLSKASSSSH
jgi:hypothetical protein